MSIVKKKSSKSFRLADLDMSPRIPKARYEKKLAALQGDLRRTALAYFSAGHRGIVVFEGWDAAGKGGVIRRMSTVLDPRGCKVWPIAAPSPDEQKHHYLARFMARLPTPGTIAVFDRSWYGRVLVERVEGLCSERQWRRAYKEINDFEAMLAADDVKIVKLFLHITPEEQLRRFEDRLNNPLKRWKITTEDIRNRTKWDEYEEAIEDMIARTSKPHARWHVIAGENKNFGRIEALRLIVKGLTDGFDLAPPPLDPEVERAARLELGVKPHLRKS